MTRRTEHALIALAMGGAALGGAFSGNEPTGLTGVDAAWSAALAAGIALCATKARRWTWVVLAAVATVMASGPGPAACGAVALVIAIIASFVDVRGPVTGAFLAACAMQSILRLSDFGVSRLSGVAAGIACAVTAWSAYDLARRRTRKLVRRVLLGAAIGVGAVTLAAAAAINDARAGAELGTERTRAALKMVQDGDSPGAEAELRGAADAFARGHATITSFWTAPARVLPGLGLQVAAAAELASIGTDITRTAGITVGSADYRSVRLAGGRLDLPRLAEMVEPLEQAVASLRVGRSRAERITSPWLLPWVASQTERLDEQIDRVLPATELAVDAARNLPGILGAGGTRRYLVLFAQPAEARGLGGFVGGYGELTATDGKLELVHSGPIEELSEHQGRNQRTLSGPPEFLDRYTRFRPTRYFQNITASPDLPTVMGVFQELYPQAGGQPIDGVIYADPAGLAAMLALTGPVEVPGLDQKLTADNAEAFLVREQYVLVAESSERDTMLTGVGRATFDALLDADVPGPERLGRVLGPAVQGQHLLMSVADTGGQAFVDRVGLSGRFQAPAGEDWLSARVFNGNGNKIDSFLQRKLSYDAVYEPSSGRVTSTATVRLENQSPTDGFPERVIGNANGDPPGTNRVYLSVHSPLGLVGAELDGRPASVEPQHEFGGSVYSLELVLPPGGASTLVLRLEGTITASPTYRLTLSPQPLPMAGEVDVAVRGKDGSGAVVPVAAGGGAEVRDGAARRAGPAVEVLHLDARFAGP